MKKEKASHPEESNVPDQMSLKRDKKQIEALVYSLKRNIHGKLIDTHTRLNKIYQRAGKVY